MLASHQPQRKYNDSARFCPIFTSFILFPSPIYISAIL